MSGSIPSSISNCKSLEVLQLNNNYFSSLPSDFGKGLVGVKNVLLFTNAFNCEIPFASMCEMVQLHQLQIQNNGYLRGTLSTCIGAWKLLETLIIEDTAVGGVIPKELFELSSLKILILSQSFFNGSIPDMFTDLPKLTTITIESRHIGNTIIQPAISGTMPSSLFKLTKLESLTLQFNMLSGTIPDSFASSPNIYQFLVNNNKLSGTLPESLLDYMKKPLPPNYAVNPRIYTFDYNTLTGTVPDFSKVVGFSKLLVNYNPFSGYINPVIYDKDYPWLNSTGSPDERNRKATFFAGMRLLPPVQAFARAMGAVSLPFYLSGALTVQGKKGSPSIINNEGHEKLAVEAGYRVDVPNNIKPGVSGINIVMCNYSAVICGTPPGSDWIVLDSVNHPIEQNVTYPTTVGDVSFTIPISTMKDLLGKVFFSIVFNGNTYNKTGITDVSYGPLPSAVIYDPSPSVISTYPRTTRRWGCQSIEIDGSNFADTGPNLYCIFKQVGDDDVFTGPATYHDSSSITCEILARNSEGYRIDTYEVYVTPNNGSTLSIYGVNGTQTIEFKDDCTLSPAITSLPRGVDCPCGMCECTSAGACYHNETTDSMRCECDYGFEGLNCETCSYVCFYFILKFVFHD